MDHSVLLAVLCVHIVLHVPASSGTCAPESVVERGVSPFLKQQIVNIHNEYRRQNAMGRVAGQPKAANMLRMTWDESLAQQAQAVAETCEFKHVKVKDPRFSVGQNLYTSYNSEDKPGANWTRALQSWYDENKDYHFGSTRYDHYTQMVWATSDKLGCGYVKYRTNVGVERLYVCHYGPGGNVVGKAPYQVGTGCENLCMLKDDNKYERPLLPERYPRPPKRYPGPPKWIPRPPMKISRPQRPLTYPSNIMALTPKPKPYSKPRPPKRYPSPPKWSPRPPMKISRPQKPLTYPSIIMPLTPQPKPYSKPRPPKRIPYRPRPKYRPPIESEPKAQPGYKPTREDALLAMIMYLLIQNQAELEAKKAQAAQQNAEDDYHADEYYDEPEYEDETVPQEADGDYNGQNYPHDNSQYRRLSAREDNKNYQRQPKLQSSKDYVINFKKYPYYQAKYKIEANGAGKDDTKINDILNSYRRKNSNYIKFKKYKQNADYNNNKKQ